MPKPIVSPGDEADRQRLHNALGHFEESVEPLIGIKANARRDVLIAQLIESQRRTRYIEILLDRELSENALDPETGRFDPLKGAILRARDGDHDEACWLVFLSVHFGRHRNNDWELPGQFYGRLGQEGYWNWPSVVADPIGMRDWLEANYEALQSLGARFGNHRKYESLRGWTPTGSGAAIASYVEWAGPSHAQCFDDETTGCNSPEARYAALYKALQHVVRFGRTARFDYLSMLGKLGLADIRPDSAHLVHATGPQTGARLLFTGSPKGSPSAGVLEERLAPLRDYLLVDYDVLEDALCNWQKSPSSFVSFRG